MSLLLASISPIIREGRNDSNLMRGLYAFLKKGGGVPTKVQLGQLAKADNIQVEPLDFTVRPHYGDRRLQKILLKGIRKFPAYGERYYALDFGDHGTCHSCVYLGSNGVGKTSLYSAIEWASLGKLDSAKSREYTSREEQIEFLKYHNAQPEDAIIHLSSHDGTATYILADNSDRTSKFSLPAFFCMEQDIAELSKERISEYIAEQLGLSDYYLLLYNMGELLVDYERHQDSFNGTKSQLEELEFRNKLLDLLYGLEPSTSRIIFHASDYTSDAKTYRFRLSEDVGDKYRYLNSLKRRLKRIQTIICNLFDNKEIAGSKLNRHILKLDDAKLTKVEWGPNSTWGTDEDELTDKLEAILNHIDSNLTRYTTNPILKDTVFMKSWLKLEHERNENKINIQKRTLHELESICSILGTSKHQRDIFSQAYKSLSDEYTKYINELMHYGETVFKYLFKPFFGQDISDVRLETDNDGTGLRVVLMAVNPLNRNAIGEVSPRKYLNTFRFKLYCVALKVSLCICCSKLYGIEFPLVIDDVFDSSDFNNRERIRDFIRHLFQSYSELLPGKHPLQLLFFTQDDVIGDSVFRGIQDAGLDENIRYSRIFNFYEAEDEEWKSEILNGNKIDVLYLQDNILYR